MESRASAGAFAAVLEGEGFLVDSITPLIQPSAGQNREDPVAARMIIGRIESGEHTLGFQLTLLLSPALCGALGLVNRVAGEEVPIVFAREPAGVLSVRPVLMGSLSMTIRRNGGAFLILPWYHMDDAWLACPRGLSVEYSADITHIDSKVVRFVGVKPKEVTQ